MKSLPCPACGEPIVGFGVNRHDGPGGPLARLHGACALGEPARWLRTGAGERRLETRLGPSLYQQSLALMPDPTPPPKRERAKLPTCPTCESVGLKPARHYLGSGQWACDRGHGRLGVQVLA